VIQSFRHKGLENFFYKGQTKGIKAEHKKKLKQILAVLNAAVTLNDISDIKPFRCHALTGVRKNEHALWVNKNWRITFEFENGDVFLTNYEDYHDCKIRR
jgi:proteic killer suppression protein